ncbi:hypothetical protein H5410_014750 [Solanum commersonii]|uniref:Uncharacterized protein n=1 Tax=Solanum commersonii TaxID=4109 RepID=A0A9J5ZRU1_SOLCO|nr:hypothetical protein H5410_014750 [Solanum commersonii]
MSHRCTHAMSDVCRPWLMLPVVGRRCSTNARRPRLMSSSRCAHATVDACRSWPKSPLVDRYA